MKTLRDIVLRQVPVVEPSASLAEVIALMEDEPLKTVVLVGDEMYMGVFNQAAIDADLIPKGEDLSLLQVGPYIHPSRVVGEFHMTVPDTLALMIRRSMDVIPVVDNRIYRGVVTQADLQ